MFVEGKYVVGLFKVLLAKGFEFSMFLTEFVRLDFLDYFV